MSNEWTTAEHARAYLSRAEGELLDVETQLRWLREIGFEEADCYWKWRQLALLVGRRPRGAAP